MGILIDFYMMWQSQDDDLMMMIKCYQIIINYFAEQAIKPKALCTTGKHSSPELQLLFQDLNPPYLLTLNPALFL